MAQSVEITQAFTALGFDTIGSVIAGVWRGYAISLQAADNGICSMEVAVRLDRKEGAAAQEALNKALRQSIPRRVYGVGSRGTALRFSVRFDRKSPAEPQAQELLEQVTGALAGMNIPPAATCILCGGASPESLGMVKGWQPVHAGCVHQNTVQTREAAEHNRLHGSYLTGILGAVLGAAVGMIPNLLTILFMDTVVAILFALVPLASMWRYRKLGGKMNRASIVIVILLSLVSVLFMSTLVASYQIMEELALPFGLAFRVTLAYVFTAEGFPLLIKDSLLEFVFMALGIFIAWRFLNRTGGSSARLAEASEMTLRPNPAYGTPEDTAAQDQSYITEREDI